MWGKQVQGAVGGFWNLKYWEMEKLGKVGYGGVDREKVSWGEWYRGN